MGGEQGVTEVRAMAREMSPYLRQAPDVIASIEYPAQDAQAVDDPFIAYETQDTEQGERMLLGQD